MPSTFKFRVPPSGQSRIRNRTPRWTPSAWGLALPRTLLDEPHVRLGRRLGALRTQARARWNFYFIDDHEMSAGKMHPAVKEPQKFPSLMRRLVFGHLPSLGPLGPGTTVGLSGATFAEVFDNRRRVLWDRRGARPWSISGGTGSQNYTASPVVLGAPPKSSLTLTLLVPSG